MKRFIYIGLALCIVLSLLLALVPNAAQAQANRGAWAAYVSYNAGDTVTYGGITYTCRQSHRSLPGWEPPNVLALWLPGGGGGGTTNPPPTTPPATNPPPTTPPATNPPPTTPPPGSGCWPAWSASTAYSGGAQVSRSGRNYQAAYWTQGNDPVTSSGPAGSGQPWIPLLFCGSGNPTSPPGGTGFAAIVSSTQFNQMFPSRNAFYTYQGLVTAADFYPSFAGTGDTTARKREAAAALANFSHETGGLWYITEIAQGLYCDTTNTQYPCAAGKRYYGRGPIQLSWNFNYGAAGQALGLPLLANPDLVQQDAAVAWKTALWYWMTQNGPGTMTAHSCMTTGAGFGCTIRSINGALECNGGNGAQVQSRINYFNTFLSILGVTAGPGNLGC